MRRFIYFFSVLLAGSAATAQTSTVADYERDNTERNLRWMLERERRASGEKERTARRVAVYADAGVWHPGARSVVEALEREAVACATIDRSVLTDEGLRGFDVLVIPGGWAPSQWTGAGEIGLRGIRGFVERGGRCVGICAGAYLLSRTVKYDGASFNNPLGLFDGSAVGPVPGLAPFPKPGSARLHTTVAGRARGLEEIDKSDVYYSGGPRFEGGTGVTVLAVYSDGTAAAISRPVGKGEVVLIGAHAERPPPPATEDAAPPASAGAILKALGSPRPAK